MKTKSHTPHRAQHKPIKPTEPMPFVFSIYDTSRIRYRCQVFFAARQICTPTANPPFRLIEITDFNFAFNYGKFAAIRFDFQKIIFALHFHNIKIGNKSQQFLFRADIFFRKNNSPHKNAKKERRKRRSFRMRLFDRMTGQCFNKLRISPRQISPVKQKEGLSVVPYTARNAELLRRVNVIRIGFRDSVNNLSVLLVT